MIKEVTIVDYKGTRVKCDVPNWEDVISVYIIILSGDEVLRVVYKDGDLKEFDSSDCRLMDFHDDAYKIPLDKIDEFSNLEGHSYNRADIVRGWVEQ